MPSTYVAAPAPGRAVPQEGHGFEPLPWWQNAWRLALAWVLGLVFFAFYLLPIVMSAVPSGRSPAFLVGMLLLDLVVGHLALVLAAYRRRAPATIAVVTMALSAVSSFSVAPAYLALMSLATHRRVVPLLWVGLLNVLSGVFSELVILSQTMPPEFREGITGKGWLVDGAIYVAFVTLFFGIVVLIGWNIGSRRELMASWRRQAETANNEQAARVAQAQLAERARIAREMHDVLAHRLSLVAMHAGALAHRPDLSDAERAEAAEVVRAGTHQALQELREVLGVLRDEGDEDDEGAGRVEAPQPGLSGIPSLVAEVTSSGQEVRLAVEEDLWRRSLSLPTSTGRHAYRVVQESLTNARRHSRGGVATVEIEGAPGQGLSIVVSNPARPVEEGSLPSGGRGLAGMAERVQLAGGRFEAGMEVSHFVVRAWMPWPGDDDDD